MHNEEEHRAVYTAVISLPPHGEQALDARMFVKHARLVAFEKYDVRGIRGDERCDEVAMPLHNLPVVLKYSHENGPVLHFLFDAERRVSSLPYLPCLPVSGSLSLVSEVGLPMRVYVELHGRDERDGPGVKGAAFLNTLRSRTS